MLIGYYTGLKLDVPVSTLEAGAWVVLRNAKVEQNLRDAMSISKIGSIESICLLALLQIAGAFGYWLLCLYLVPPISKKYTSQGNQRSAQINM